MRICAVLAEAIRALQHSADIMPVVVQIVVFSKKTFDKHAADWEGEKESR